MRGALRTRGIRRIPNDIEAVWELAEHRFVYIEHLPEHAGHAQHTIFADDLDGVRKVSYRAPDGNEIGFGGAPHENDVTTSVGRSD